MLVAAETQTLSFSLMHVIKYKENCSFEPVASGCGWSFPSGINDIRSGNRFAVVLLCKEQLQNLQRHL